MNLEFDVVDLPPTDHVDEGEEAPDFTRPLVNDEYWEDAALSELAEDGPVLLVFHPIDDDFPANYMWQEFTERRGEDEFDVTLVGLSISTDYEHNMFIDDQELD